MHENEGNDHQRYEIVRWWLNKFSQFDQYHKKYSIEANGKENTNFDIGA